MEKTRNPLTDITNQQTIQSSSSPEKTVLKRNGVYQKFSKDKIKHRLEQLMIGLSSKHMDLNLIINKVTDYTQNGLKTTELDNLLAETAAYLNILHPDFGKLAARITVTKLHKETDDLFIDVIKKLHFYIDNNGDNASLIADDVYQIISENHEKLQKALDYKRDWDYDYFGFKTLERAYLLKVNNKIVERPQHLIMRVSIGIHKKDIDAAIETYHLMSERWFTHATPTLFNAGTPKPQMSSCFLLTMKDDSIDGIYDTLRQTALISKSAGGVGLAVHCVRSTGSYIKGTNGYSNGLIPMLRVFNETARYVDQGGGKRKGSFAIYLEPWHADVYEFLQLRKNHGKEEQKARDLFYALWIPDLFMKRVKNNEDWTLFCPNEAKGLYEVYGEEFENLYMKYEKEGKGRKTMKAQKLWEAIIDSQIETGTPYILFKDHANSKSNQKHLGTIKSSNLCCEIIEYTSPDEVAVCNLASISLPRFIENGILNFEKLHEVSKVITKNLNKIIDNNYYPIQEAKTSNLRHRPIGIGIQGLADALIMLKIPFEDEQANKLNAEIFETIYHAAMQQSMEIAKIDGHYETFKGSPLSQGIFQFDMWNEKPATSRYDWDLLREEVMKFGARNSLLLAPMPTASTSQILGNNESFEPYTTNLYTRRVLAGEFICINPHLVRDLIKLGLWNDQVRNQLIANNGSVQAISQLPMEYKKLYKTVWEISQKKLIDLARARAPYICQSQSLNIYLAEPSYSKLTTSHFYAWSQGLKTGQYYLRSRPSRDAIKFTVDMESLLKVQETTNMFSHMNTGNLSKAEMDKQKRYKKRKLNEISNTLNTTQTSDNQPTKLDMKAKDVKECPFNPFGNDSCDMCGS